MRTMNPLKGLLLYFWYDAGAKLIMLFVQAIAWGIAFAIWGGAILLMFFGINAVMGASMVVISGMGNKEIDWERFQLSMPVKRADLASSQYLSVGIAAFIGVPIFVIFTGLNSIWHEGAYFTLASAFLSLAPFLSMPFILGGLVFPLYMMPWAEKMYEALFPMLMVVAILLPQSAVMAAGRWNWQIDATVSITLVVSMLIFVGSYFVTRKLYAKADF